VVTCDRDLGAGCYCGILLTIENTNATAELPKLRRGIFSCTQRHNSRDNSTRVVHRCDLVAIDSSA
jgi:hypothetical protein